MIRGYEANSEKSWMYVPREPATFGHLIVVSGKHYEDISDKRLVNDAEQQKELMRIVVELCSKMEESLTYKGEKCEKIYVVTECETPNLHLHFHLLPRFRSDKNGHMFLFEKELEEARWMLENNDKEEKKEDKIRDMHNRIGVAEGFLDFHKYLICSNKWVKSNDARDKFIKEIKEEIERILEKKNS